MKVHFLGCGDAFGSGGRNQTAYLLEEGGRLYLLDCGPAALFALKRAGFHPDALEAIFLTHLHGDHFGGLPFFFIDYLYNEPRSRPLPVAGPPGTAERARSLMALMYGEKTLSFVEFPVLEPGSRRALAGAEIEAFRVPHQTDAISLALKVTIGGKTVLYSGDSSWTDEFVEQSEGTDLFICECCFFDTESTTHMSYTKIAANRARLQCKQLILTHMGDEMLERRESLPIVAAFDGLVVEI
jgi:ribonuclease BN (tRNA processing enzyme)